MYKRTITFYLFCIFFIPAKAQFNTTSDSSLFNYSTPKEYTIGDINVIGSDHLDHNVLRLLSGLNKGDKIQVPGDKFSTAIENLWKQGLFQDVKITASKIRGNVIDLNFIVSERPRLSKYTLTGVKKSEADDLRDKIKLIRGKVLTDGLTASTVEIVKEYFIEKGYLDVKVETKIEKDPKTENNVILAITVIKGDKVRIQDINFIGVKELYGKFPKYQKLRLRMALKETKRRRWYAPYNAAKLSEKDYEKDKKALIAKYNEKGFRDARVVRDSIYRVSSDRINIDLVIDEGHKYYFRNINWIGNSKYPSSLLTNILGIKKGEVYDQTKLNTRLFMNPNGNDISSLYMDDGYLFFNITPVEIMATNDSIDIEMRIYEGKQATINKITIVGNTKTNDRVILREIRTQPGQLFRRSDIIRSQREISQLGYFDPEKMGVTPTPNQTNGTVDVEYAVQEKPSDQIQLSGGYGGKKLVGTLGVSFTNFSTRNFFRKDAWRPLPTGDGQRLSIQAQSNGLAYRSYNISFTEPWLGGKKPNSLSFTTYHSIQTNNQTKKIKVNGEKVDNPTLQALEITGASIGLGRRLKWPDDYFSLYQEVDYEYYTLTRYNTFFSFSDGYSNNLYYRILLQRNSIDKPIFETRGSQISLSGQFTPPYSMFNNKDYNNPEMSQQERYKFVEYQKYKFTVKYFLPITNKRGSEGKEARNLILKTSAGFGFVSAYNSKTGTVPFERFYLGGSGLTGYTVGGREIIALRGYDDNGSVSPSNGGAYIAKYSMELRFPLTLNPQATIYVLGFADAGNSWNYAKDFNPFNVKRSTGVGVRIFLPMFGLLGFDYGWRLDNSDYGLKSYMQKSQFHFTIGATIGEL